MPSTKKYDKNFIYTIFYFPNSYSQKLIKYTKKGDECPILLKSNKNTETNLKKEMEKQFTQLKKVKDIQLKNQKENPKKAYDVEQVISGFTRGVSRHFNQHYQFSKNRGVSNAFIKAWEVYSTFPFHFKKSKNQKIKSFHFAEMPGQFINSLASYINSNFNKTLDWNAESLNPKNPTNIKKYGNELFDDKYGLYKDYKNNWKFGKKDGQGNGLEYKDTGDITDFGILSYFRDYNRSSWHPEIITADAGLNSDMMETAHLQKLELAQAIATISSSSLGGDVIVKHFGPYDPTKPKTKKAGEQFMGLIYLYYLHFSKIYLYKPLSSSNVSAEFYVIGLGLNKEMKTEDFQDLCSKMTNLKENELFIKMDEMPTLFKGQVLKFLEELNNINKEGLENQNYLYQFWDEFKEQTNGCLKTLQEEKMETWLKLYMF